MAAADETFEHSDLVLATTIMMLADQEGTMARRGKQVFWSYPQSERLAEVVVEFRSGSCRVDPLLFAKALRVMRSKVYDLMEYHPPRVQPQQPESAS